MIMSMLLWLRYLVRATLEVHRNSPCLSCIISKFHHRNRHIGQQGLVFGPWFMFIWLPLRMCFHAIAARTSTQICMATATPTAFLDFTTSSSPDVIWCLGLQRMSWGDLLFGPKNWTPKEMVPPCSC